MPTQEDPGIEQCLHRRNPTQENPYNRDSLCSGVSLSTFTKEILKGILKELQDEVVPAIWVWKRGGGDSQRA